MITNGINFKNFLINKKSKQITIILNHILNKKNQVIQSLSSNYKDSFNIKILNKYKKFKNFRVIGIGGSSLGTEAIYNFLRKKIKKNFSFINDLDFTTENKYNNDATPDWEMDEAHIDHLKELGLWDEEDDGEEYVTNR